MTPVVQVPTRLIDNQTVGDSLAISISTSIPVERLLLENIGKGYNHLFINVRTLWRNFVGSFDHDISIDPVKPILARFIIELTTIKSIIEESVSTPIKPIFYFPSYITIARQFPQASIKYPSTPKQIKMSDFEKDIFTRLFKTPDSSFIKMFDVKIDGDHSTALIITHSPVDLLSAFSFRKLTLLESHTGNLKNKTEWILKLNKNEAYRNIPFCPLAIQVIGDNNNLFEAKKRIYTDSLINLAKTCNWSALTSNEKIKFDIKKIKEPVTVTLFTAMTNIILK